MFAGIIFEKRKTRKIISRVGLKPLGKAVQILKIVLLSKIDITRGPINTAHIAFKTNEKEFAYTIEDSTIPKMVAPAFATILELTADLEVKVGGNSWKKLSQDIRLLYRFGVMDLKFQKLSLIKQASLFSKAWNDDAVKKIITIYLRIDLSKMRLRSSSGASINFNLKKENIYIINIILYILNIIT